LILSPRRRTETETFQNFLETETRSRPSISGPRPRSRVRPRRSGPRSRPC